MPRTELIQRYRSYLPVSDRTPVISLMEGDTPLIASCRVAEWAGAPRLRLFLKYEGLNPTGSFKDRGMTLAISKAAEAGSKAVITASTGNTSASAAAYAARAGMRCVVLIPDGQIALGKLSQALVHGAEVFAVQGNFDDALAMVRRVGEAAPITVVNSINPYRIESQKTGAFEIVDQLGQAPDYHFIPVGNAGNITAYWKGYKEYHSLGKSRGLPKMIGWQAEGAAPIVKGEAVKDPKTIATAIKIGNPASWKGALAARDESGGTHRRRVRRGNSRGLQGVGPGRRVLRAGQRGLGGGGQKICFRLPGVRPIERHGRVCVDRARVERSRNGPSPLAPRPKPVAPTVDAIRSELGSVRK
jgi:threonine synthase